MAINLNDLAKAVTLKEGMFSNWYANTKERRFELCIRAKNVGM